MERSRGGAAVGGRPRSGWEGGGFGSVGLQDGAALLPWSCSRFPQRLLLSKLVPVPQIRFHFHGFCFLEQLWVSRRFLLPKPVSLLLISSIHVDQINPC